MNGLSLASTITLRDGKQIPRLGLGVWQCPMVVAKRAVKAALEAGYRHIDTAMIYGNEKDVGDAIRESGVAREKLYVTTKLWNQDHGYDEALRAFDASFARLNLGYVDLYLSHFPVAERRVPAWKAMQTLLKDGRCRSIGVSNYTVKHLTDLINQTGVVPVCNQVEFHPFLFQKELLEFCRKNRIQLVAYSPLTHGKRLNDPRLVQLADRHDKTPAQVLIRWGLQQDLVLIPKSSRAERIQENANVFNFELTELDMKVMSGFNENLRTCWDPTDEP